MYGSILNLPQVAAIIDEEELFSVPWGHHRVILDACKGDEEKAVFYIRKTIQNNWSRAVLGNFMETDLYGRQGKAISNFEYTLSYVKAGTISLHSMRLERRKSQSVYPHMNSQTFCRQRKRLRKNSAILTGRHNLSENPAKKTRAFFSGGCKDFAKSTR